jgi:uncharacterized protein YggE
VPNRLPSSVTVEHGELSNWSDGNRRTRWRAQRTLTLVGRDVSAAAAVSGELALVPGAALHGPMWQVDRDNDAYAAVQRDAVEEAKLRAARYAAALGGTLGRLVELADPEGAHVFGMRLSAARGSGSEVAELDFTPQQVTISASVTARWFLVLPD